MKDTKNFNITLNSADHARYKAYIYSKGLNIREYLISLIEQDMAQHKQPESKTE